jgi:hypothetical protein
LSKTLMPRISIKSRVEALSWVIAILQVGSKFLKHVATIGT